MKLFLTLLSIVLTILQSPVYAEGAASGKALQLADIGVVSKDANGDDETTVVDINGNLKVRPPVDKNGKPIDTNDNSNPNNAGDSQSVQGPPQSDN